MQHLELSEIWIYPIKSLGGMSLNSSKMDAFGLENDRRWMLVDEEGNFLSQRSHPSLSRLQVTIHARHLHVINKDFQKEFIEIPMESTPLGELMVQVWSDRVRAHHLHSSYDQYFSDFLKTQVKLVYLPATTKRVVDGRYTETKHLTAFTDGFPFLLLGTASLNHLNEQLLEPVEMRRFRPNLVFKGGEPHFEDELDLFQIGESEFRRVKPCSRCIITTIDLRTGKKSPEPLKTLASYRKRNGKVYFGQNIIRLSGDSIKVGDELIPKPTD